MEQQQQAATTNTAAITATTETRGTVKLTTQSSCRWHTTRLGECGWKDQRKNSPNTNGR